MLRRGPSLQLERRVRGIATFTISSSGKLLQTYAFSFFFLIHKYLIFRIRVCETGEFDLGLVELYQMVGIGGDVEAHGDGGNSDVEFVTGLLDVKRDCHGGGVR